MKKFPHPLDTWLEEDVNVTVIRPTMDKQGRLKLKPTVETRKQRVFYTKGIKQKLECGSDGHYFEVIDKKKGLFKCRHCPMVRKLYPITHDVVNGKIINRE